MYINVVYLYSDYNYVKRLSSHYVSFAILILCYLCSQYGKRRQMERSVEERDECECVYI